MRPVRNDGSLHLLLSVDSQWWNHQKIIGNYDDLPTDLMNLECVKS